MRYGRRAARAADTARHTAHGVEITSREIRLVRLSRTAGRTGVHRCPDGLGRIRVDDAVRHPLPPGIVAGADIVDAEALARALASCFAQQAARLAECAAARSPAGRGPSASAGMDDTSARPSSPRPSPDVASPDVASSDVASSEGATRIALALCPSVVTQVTVALDELIPGFSMRLPGRLDAAAFDALEPWVSLHAQKVSGIDPGELVVDWYPDVSGEPGRVVVAASQRHYLDVRQSVAAAAGVRMGARCDASLAALDACRFVVAQCLHTRCDDADVPSPAAVIGGACFSPARTLPRPEGWAAGRTWAETPAADETARRVAEARRAYACDAGDALAHASAPQRFAALWLGERAWRAWAFEAGDATLDEWVVPDARDPAALVAALDERAGSVALMLVAGECDALAPVGGLRALGGALRCPVIEFDASTCCDGPAATSQRLGPAASVAFGLAFRELLR